MKFLGENIFQGTILYASPRDGIPGVRSPILYSILKSNLLTILSTILAFCAYLIIKLVQSRIESLKANGSRDVATENANRVREVRGTEAMSTK